jgi:hypothetical protein
LLPLLVVPPLLLRLPESVALRTPTQRRVGTIAGPLIVTTSMAILGRVSRARG